MTAALKAEFKKLLTVRSSYFWPLAGLALIGFLSFYVQGFKSSGTALNGLFMAGTITQLANTISVFGAIIALLLMTHEYRYNTIVYTLTASNSRTKVLLSKIVAVLAYVFCLSVLLTVIGLLLTRLGVAAAGHTLPHQDVNYLTFLAKTAFVCEGFAMAGLLFGALIRNQVGAIAALFILPNTLEGLLSLLLKHNSVYMPFTALQQVVQSPTFSEARNRIADTGSLSPGKGSLVFLAYMAGGWVVAWYLFLRRDAT